MRIGYGRVSPRDQHPEAQHGRAHRGRVRADLPRQGVRQVQPARAMYDELDERGRRRYTVDQIAAEFGVTRPTIYRHLNKTTP
ncbi:TetR family transcriptional regulator [Nocardia asiatica]|uniref:TetR family transcriptional regulator n=1 Tax=Nocardia asiatica TaxID=209252 RepID=UPI002454A19A|nr:TetR family transcriptional regulator [Nocardia asiatica]